MTGPILLAHGGAGSKRPGKAALSGIQKALKIGYAVLADGGTALEAIEQTIAHMESSGVYNAGRGGNLQLDGVRRLDASIMEGSNLQAGAIIGLEGFVNPIHLARVAMGMEHKVFTNVGGQRIAEAEGLEKLGPPDEKSLKRLARALEKGGSALELYRKYFSTVGAVALDLNASLAAGSSTGGIFAMLPGRVGDTPFIGSGVYADDSCGAVSCTGRGEDILRLCLAKEVCMNMGRSSAGAAAALSFKRAASLGFQAGILALDRKGRWSVTHTTGYMPAGVASSDGIETREAFTKGG